MEKDPHLDLEIDAMAGVSGQAALNRRLAFGDISVPLRPRRRNGEMAERFADMVSSLLEAGR